MKIIAFAELKPGLTMETIAPLLQPETANTWRLSKAGIIRELYARVDVTGVVIVFECADAAEAKQYIEDFPMTMAGFIQWEIVPVAAPFFIECLFSPSVDVKEPFDRALTK